MLSLDFCSNSLQQAINWCFLTDGNILTRSRFRYLQTKAWARAIPIPGTDGRKSQPAKTHIPGEGKTKALDRLLKMKA